MRPRARHRAAAAATTLAVAVALAGCGAEAAGDDTTTTLVLGHPESAEGLPADAMLRLADRVSELTDGELEIEVFPSSQLGSLYDMQEAMEFGAIDIVMNTVGSLERYSDLAAIDGLPFLYDDEDHFRRVWEGELGTEILDAIADDSGFRMIGGMYRGPRVTNTTRPVDSVDDLAGLKLRVPTQQTYIDTWNALGASPTPMAISEVFTALEQGAIDGQENPIDVVRNGSLYEVAPYVTETNHLYGNFHLQFWDDTFQSWPDDHREALITAVDEVSDWYYEQAVTDAADHVSYLAEEGIDLIPIDLDEWRDATAHLVADSDPQVREWARQIAEMGQEGRP